MVANSLTKGQGPGRTTMTCKRLVTMLLAVLLLVGGCMKVGPKFVKPEAEVNPNWLEAGAYKQLTTTSDDYRDWWRAFNDPVAQ
jgi:hypothetical protein